MGEPPACDPDGLARREDVGGVGQADGSHNGAVLRGLLKLQQGDVIVKGEVIEGRVGDDAFELVLLNPGGAALALVQQTQEGRPLRGVRVPGREAGQQSHIGSRV